MSNLEVTTPKQSAQRDAAQALRLSSRAFADGSRIPERHTADGENVSPALSWGNPPAGTESFALICDDPDAPSGTFVHWLLWNIPPERRELEEGFFAQPERDGICSGQNDFGETQYGGPKPPPGKPHRYFFRLYALDSRLSLETGASRAELDAAMAGHILAEGALVGMYGR